jgi:hypothetical protein
MAINRLSVTSWTACTQLKRHLLERRRVEAGQDAAEGAVGGDAVGQVEVAGEPLPAVAPELVGGGERVGPGQHAADGDEDDVDHGMPAGPLKITSLMRAPSPPTGSNWMPWKTRRVSRRSFYESAHVHCPGARPVPARRVPHRACHPGGLRPPGRRRPDRRPLRHPPRLAPRRPARRPPATRREPPTPSPKYREAD